MVAAFEEMEEWAQLAFSGHLSAPLAPSSKLTISAIYDYIYDCMVPIADTVMLGHYPGKV